MSREAESALARAERTQLAASDPALSAFVTASAGSGKTKLLTDRLLRLMLGGAPPERILCLTYTRAAAAEMALRLQGRLARWVVEPSAELDAELDGLGVERALGTRERARGLFGQVLDLPGGMRIGTIHAFCQSVLRRFPLEAHLPPHFEVGSDEDAALARMIAVRGVVGGALDDRAQALALARLAEATASEDTLDRLCAEIGANERFRSLAALPGAARVAALRRAAGAPPGAVDPAPLADEAAFRAAAREVAARGKPAAASRAAAMLAWLDLTARAPEPARWAEFFLTKEGKPLTPSSLVNVVLARERPAILEAFRTEQEHALAALDAERAEAAAAISNDLAALAEPALAHYAVAKEVSGKLDYADLIRLVNQLLHDSGAAWVLYKLDGGLDHLLLDEAQDTAPEQWRIAEALTDEFFAGTGAREVRRTVFAVGDPKQSIFSFQGADPRGFALSRAAFGARIRAAGERWLEEPLTVSFRSTPPVLALVDAVFANATAAQGVVAPGEALHHDPVRADAAGSVELWPLTPGEELPEIAPWQIPERTLRRHTAPIRLATRLARWIGVQAGGGVRLPSRGRALRPGDVLVLVRRRNAFGRALVKALKIEGVPVSGLDRIALTQEPAVADVLALLKALLLPEDDLTFATFLTSPLGGLDDGDLLELCPERRRPLREVLEARAAERPAWRAAAAYFGALFARADYVSAYTLLAEALGPLGGRARLYARLGTEAAEPLDELLAAALRYARAHTPSLQGFVHWVTHAGTEVKREPEDAGEVVRLMTVHGAKGLQAPLVVLPDTTSLPPHDHPILAAKDPASGAIMPLYAPSKRYHSAAIERLLAARREDDMAEHNRLLYVALTRAQDRLLVAGWAMRKALSEACWYRLVEQGFTRLGAEHLPFVGGWTGTALRYASAGNDGVRAAAGSETAAPQARRPFPAWLGAAPGWRALPPPSEPAPPLPLAPSRPENALLGPVPSSLSPLTLGGGRAHGLRRGTLVHRALQHLSSLPVAQRRARLTRFFGLGTELTAEEAERLTDEVLAVIARPELTPLFGQDGRAEVPLTGVIGGRVVGGVVDRLAVSPTRVLVADFKTNRRPPGELAKTPVLYLAQMAAYRAVLRAIFPDREVCCLLIWTELVRVDRLPDRLLDPYDPSNAGTQR